MIREWNGLFSAPPSSNTMTALLTADWSPHGKDGYFRKFEVYNMGWAREVDLEAVTVAAASFGGPIALMRDPKKFVKVQGGSKPVVNIYTASGNLISHFIWNSGQIVELGWSSTEDLLCIQSDGAVLIYDMFATYQHTFSMGQEAQDTSVVEAQVFTSFVGTGIAILTAAHRFFLVNNVKEPKARRLPQIPGLNSTPNTWAVICEERHTRVLVARGLELFTLKESETQVFPQSVDLCDEGSCIMAMAVGPAHRQIALLSDRGKLWLGTADLRRCLRLVDTGHQEPPQQLVWCGSDAIVGRWGSTLEVIGRSEDSLTYSYDGAVHVVGETDCIRVVTSATQEILQKVPRVVQEILRINSTGPGSYLLEASKQFQRKSHRANEYIHLVKGNLPLAVQQCIEAAGHEFSPDTQKMLIKAAQFGKCFLAECDPEAYVTMCRVLRCLNAVRDPRIGIPITYPQLQHLTLQTLLDTLILRRHYYLAIQVAKYLHLPDSSRILAHWAFYKVKQTQLNQEQVAAEIALKLGQSPGVSYSEIAIKASDCGRNQLAIKLLDYESRASFQVPLLLRFGQERLALVKSIESGNTDLVYTVLLHLRDNMPMDKFQMEIRNFPLAQALYLKYCREHNRETLRDIYTQEDDHAALAACSIRESYDPKNSALREASLSAAQESFKRGRHDLYVTLCEEQLRLLKYQKTLEEKFRRDFVNKSLHDTLELLLSMQEVKLADRLRAEYKVPDRRYWWLRVECLGKINDWVELDKFAKIKKSPIGYEPFVDVCLVHNNRYEAHKYLPRVREDLRVKYLVTLGLYEEAAQTAFEKRDSEALAYVQSRCDQLTAGKVAALIGQLSTKK